MKKHITVLFLVFSMVFISCDQDFNTIGSDLVGDEHFDFSSHEAQLKAYSVKTDEVQTNNLPVNPLGIYNNPYFGVTKANFVSQVSLFTTQPKFGTNVQIENVILYVPFFSTVETTNADGSKVYALNSVYGANKESKMKLSVYENGYYLNEFNPLNNFQTAQRYFSDGSANGALINFENLKRGNDGNGNSVQNGTRLNDSPNTAENDQFFFNKAEIIVYKTKFNTTTGVLEYIDANDVVLANQNDPSLRVVKERLAPGIYLTLNKAFFKKRILEAGSANLINNNEFKQYFKGLYFKMEQLPGEEGAMAMFNFSNAKLNVNYSSVNDGAPAGTAATSKTLVLNFGTGFGSNSVSLQDYSYSGAYNSGLNASATNPSFGSDSKLYLKGGKGSVVYIDVFGDVDVLKPVNGQLVAGANQIPDELDQLRLKGWLINEAYLEFYIDKTAMAGANQLEAERLYLFDATNQKSLVDYTFDATTNPNIKYNKLIFGGIIERDNTADKKGIKYKIRITDHIDNLLNSTDSNLNKNVRLGLSVTENINYSNNYYYKSPFDVNNTPTISSDDIEYFPLASIMEQQGVVLHGTNPSAPADASKKLKLVIHYTKPN
ncbi:DUF4270 domain-containing protein [Flavobacterium sp.]|jgi:hypothetical protein|uniref:DUF4270 domain-containing protein n=1 Tax=Flavobacterium sp. TaxID=239 RepID=UPI0037BE9E3D